MVDSSRLDTTRKVPQQALVCSQLQSAILHRHRWLTKAEQLSEALLRRLALIQLPWGAAQR
jgi:hypothetical protein